MKKLNSLQALKATACLLIFCHHAGMKVVGVGAIGVFFVCSGFTMVYSYHSKPHTIPQSLIGCLRFALKRIAKLYVLYILCMIPVLLLDLRTLLSAFSPQGAAFFAKRLAASLLLIQTWFPNSEIALAFNGSAWFLSTIMFLYFCFPWLFRLFSRSEIRSRALLIIALLIGLQFAAGFALKPLEDFLLGKGADITAGRFSYWFSYLFPPFRVLDFSMGCLLGFFYIDHRDKTPSLSLLVALDIVLVLLWAAAIYIYWNSHCFLTSEAFRYTQLFTPAALLSVYVFALGQGPAARLLTNRFTLFIAGISSYFFLIHQDIIRFTTLFFNMASAPAAVMKFIVPPLCFGMTVVACLVWARIDKAMRGRLGKN